MAHISNEQIKAGARAELGDTFTYYKDGLRYQAYTVNNGPNPCAGCAFECSLEDYEGCRNVPDCVAHDVIYVKVVDF